MTDKTPRRPSPRSNQERSEEIEGVRRGRWIESAIGLSGLLLLFALTVALGATAWTLNEREEAWAEESRTLGELWKQDMDATGQSSAGATPRTGTPSVKGGVTPGIAAAVTTPKSIGQTSDDLQRGLDKLEGWMKEVRQANGTDGREPGSFPELVSLLKSRRQMDAQGTNFQGQIDNLNRVLEAKEVQATKAQDQLVVLEKAKKMLMDDIARQNTSIETLEGQKEDIEAQLRQAKKQVSDLRNKQPKERTPDPALVTLALVVDADTKLDFLMDGLMSLYTFHNTREKSATDGESLVIDVLRNGQILTVPTSGLPVRVLDDLNTRFANLVAGLELRPGSLPHLGEMPKGLPAFFTAFPKQKQRQLILVAGSECSAPDPKTWDKLAMPVHVCIIHDGTSLLPDFETDWRKFTTSKAGDFKLLKVDFQSPASRRLVETQFRFWVEDRLCFP